MADILQRYILLPQNFQYIDAKYRLSRFIKDINIRYNICLCCLIVIHYEVRIIELDVSWSKVKFHFWICFYFEGLHSVCAFVEDLFVANDVPKLLLQYHFFIE